MNPQIEAKTQVGKSRIRHELRRLREEKGYTQTYVADEIGMSVNAYQKIESGQTNMTIDHLWAICEVLEADKSAVIRRAETGGAYALDETLQIRGGGIEARVNEVLTIARAVARTFHIRYVQ